MASRGLWCAGLGLVYCLSASPILAAGVPSVADVMRVQPKQKDVEFETPKEAEYSKCKIDVERKSNSVALVAVGPAGQTLRKFIDTDGDNEYDQFRFYNLGIEVYRDIDSNKNKKIDQYRWLNRGGTRWGIDRDEDLHIDQWKAISAAEASREAIRAMAANDIAALRAVMVNADDLKAIGLNAQLVEKVLQSTGDLDKKVKNVMKASKIFTPQSTWTRFDAQFPNVIPVDDEKAKEDVQIYESSYAIIETPKKDGTKKSDAVQMGEMIRIGEVWKLTQVPTPIEGDAITTSPILMEPIANLASNESNMAATSPKVQKVLTEIQDLDQRVLQPNQPPKKVQELMSKRAALFKEAQSLAETPDEKASLTKQNVDLLAIAAQAGTYAEGVDDLKAIEADIAKKSPDSPLLPYTMYRRIQADFAVKGQNTRGSAAAAKLAPILKDYLDELEEFVNKFPNAEDGDDALWNLGNQLEFQGRDQDAIARYQRLVKDKPKSERAAQAQGALRRLNLNGQPLNLTGTLTTDGNFDMKFVKDKVCIVVFWNSAFVACEEDIPQLRALYRDHKKDGLEIIGIALENDKKIVQGYVQKNEMTWPQIYEAGNSSGIQGQHSVQFGIVSFPTMFLVNRAGKVVNRSASMTEIKTELPELLNAKK